MTVYYVRKTGNDGEAGTSAGAAWLTIDHAMNTVAAADVVWIGAGIYRETVTVDTPGTAGSEIEFRADITGVNTGDAGLVTITVSADEVGTGGAGVVLNLNGKTFVEFYDIIFGPGGTGSADYTVKSSGVNSTFEGVVFEGCTFLPPLDAGNAAVYLDYATPGAITGNQPIMRDCVINGGASLFSAAAPAADRVCGWQIENCVFVDHTLIVDGPAAGAFGVTGWQVSNCTFLATNMTIADQFGTGTIGDISNNVYMGDGNFLTLTADGGAWTGDYNVNNTESTWTTAGGYTGGGNDDTKRTLITGLFVDHILRRKIGYSPYSPFEPVWDHNGSGLKSGNVDYATAAKAPAADLLDSPRPMGRQNDDGGAVETRRRPEQETTTVYDGNNAAAFKGAGYMDIFLPVAAAATTVTVQAYYDANYAGTLPTMQVLFIPGVADQSDVQTGAAAAWEALSCTFTPSATGVVVVRLLSYDTSANGECYFDGMEVS